MTGPARFRVTERLGPIATLAKQPVDHREAIFDFSRWLAPGETLSSVSQYGIVANPEIGCGGGTWWPEGSSCCSSSGTIANTSPLVMVSLAMRGYQQAMVLLGQGTPGLTYGVSFLAVATPTQRQKAVDFLVCVAPAIAGIELSAPPLGPPPPHLTVHGSTTLPIGTSGSVFVDNTSGVEITITLPSLPQIDQEIDIKDIAGNAATWNIVVVPVGGLIDDMANYRIAFGFGNLGLRWTGTRWSIM